MDPCTSSSCFLKSECTHGTYLGNGNKLMWLDSGSAWLLLSVPPFPLRHIQSKSPNLSYVPFHIRESPTRRQSPHYRHQHPPRHARHRPHSLESVVVVDDDQISAQRASSAERSGTPQHRRRTSSTSPPPASSSGRSSRHAVSELTSR